MIFERQKNLAAAAAAAADNSALAPNTPAIGGVQQAGFMKQPSLLQRAAGSPGRVAVTAAGAAAAAGSPTPARTSSGGAGATALASTFVHGPLRCDGSQEAAASVASSSALSLGGTRLAIAGSIGSYKRSTPNSLSVDIFGGYSTLSNPTGLVRAFSMAGSDYADEQGMGAVSSSAQEAAETDEPRNGVDQSRLLQPQNSIQDGMHWFV
jgi:hypothetical protein